MKPQGSNKGIETRAHSIYVRQGIGLFQAVSLHTKLKVCVGARVMLTNNTSIFDGLING